MSLLSFGVAGMNVFIFGLWDKLCGVSLVRREDLYELRTGSRNSL
jgi:hypothetical protein